MQFHVTFFGDGKHKWISEKGMFFFHGTANELLMAKDDILKSVSRGFISNCNK